MTSFVDNPLPVSVRGSAVREEEGNLVAGLRTKRNKVPEHVGVLKWANTTCKKLQTTNVQTSK